VLIVLSTDMSHYRSAKVANAMDHQALDLIKRLDAERFWDQCAQQKIELCGFAPVTTGILLAQQRGLKAKILKYADSGDVSKDKSAVVGYFSAIFFQTLSQDNNAQKAIDDNIKKDKTVLLSESQKKRLLEIARTAIVKHITGKGRITVQEADPRLNLEEGAFVTIHKNGHLRGCIGNVLGQGPLYRTVSDMAIAAASQDPRFSPVSSSELDRLEIEVSVLSKPWKIKDPKEIELGVHGVIVKKGLFHQGLFLPQVATEQGWNREQFLSYLCQHKAGLPADAWKDPSVTLEVFTAQVFSEKIFKH
jgi:MEMO1 family protein